MRINPEVKRALENGEPVVALETTIVSHGMPYPESVKTALEVERIIRENGAVPATIGIIDGEPVIGLTPEEIDAFGTQKGIWKVSRRDLPIVMARREWGATTVAGTMILAHMAGIRFFVTGGIGGVQRGWETTLDISADLEELGRTSVCVICAGAKYILDIPATAEVLETKGVPILGIGTERIPGFFVRETEGKVDARCDTPEEIARICDAKWSAGLEGGLLAVDPIPEEHALDRKVADEAIDAALKEMEEKGIRGKDETPFLLQRIAELTGGESLMANIALIENNARDGARIAVAYSKIRRD